MPGIGGTLSGPEGAGAVIIGGGPVGSLLATLLSDQGLDVDVYERRPDLRAGQTAAGGRSINLVLTRRGIRALEQVGLAEDALRLTVPVTGRIMHSLAGELTYQPYGRNESECNHSISRGGLNAFLVGQAEDRGVRFHFGSRLVDLDCRTGHAMFEDESSGERFTVTAPVLFGADGAGSAVRAAMGRLDGFEDRIDMLGHGYKELTIPADESGDFRVEGTALHIWPRGDFMLMALANLDGSFTATLYLPYEGRDGFDGVKTDHDVFDLFGRHFPDAIPLIPELVEEFFDNPTGTLGTVRCAPWHHADKVLLIGDAAHGIVPFFGQGMNSGFEDCTELGRLLDEYGVDRWGEVFEEMTRRRRPNADAIADMALENFVEMRDRVGDERFLLRKEIEHRLEQEMPLRYRSRYSMVMYSHIPYAVAFEAGRIQQQILDQLCSHVDAKPGLDLPAARRLIDEKLAPFLREHEISLDY